MANPIGEAFVRVRSDTTGFQQETGRSILGTLGKIGAATGAAFAGFRIFGFIKDSVIGFNSTLEQSRTAFTNLLGSGEAANKMLANLQQFARTTPFAFQDLIPVSQQLVGALGKSADVIPIMTHLGDAISATGGSADTLRQLTLAYTQMATSGVAHMGDLLQINNAVPGALSKMAQAAGESVGQFRTDVSKGMITSGEAVKLFTKVTTDPKFGIAGGMEAQSRTFQGAVSNIQDALQQMLASAGAPIFGFVSTVAKGFASFLSIMQADGINAAIRETFGANAGAIFAQFETFLSVTATAAQTAFGLIKSAISALAGIIVANQGTIVAVISGIQAAIAAAIPPLTGLFNFVTGHQEIFGALAAGIVIATAAIFGIAAAMVIGTAAATAFGAALAFAFSPITIIVVSVGLLVAALIYLYRTNQTAREIMQSAWHAIGAIITTTIAIVRSVISAFVSFATAFWSRFGSLITAETRVAFNTIRAYIQGVMQVIRGVINVVLGIIHGNWSQVWHGIQQITSGVIQALGAIVRGGIAIVANAARAIATGAFNAIQSGLSKIPGMVSKIIHGIPGALGNLGSLLFNAGKQIIEGLIRGIESLAGSVASKVSDIAHSAVGAVGSALGIGSPSRVFHEQVGVPIMQGWIGGMEALRPAAIRSAEGIAGGVLDRAKADLVSARRLASSLTPVNAPLPASAPAARGSVLAAAFAGQSAGIHIDHLEVKTVHPDPARVVRGVLDEVAALRRRR